MERTEPLEALLLRVERAADLADISRSKAYELVATREWPSITIGRCRRIPLSGLRAWLERQTTEDGRGE